MKRLKLFVFLILCGITAFPILGASDSNTVTIPSTNDRPKENPHNRPKAPARNGIVCTYSSNSIEMQLPADLSMVSVAIWNEDGNAWSGIISQDEPYSPLPGLAGEYTIECIGNNGNTYSAIIYF